MRRQGIINILFLFLFLVSATACGSGEKETTQKLVKVGRGDLTVSVSGSGNIKVEREVSLSFGSSGRIEKINAKEGDKVTKGDVLASLNTSALELAQTQAQVALTKARVALTQAQVALTQAQVALTQAQVALTKAQVDQQTAELELESTLDKKGVLKLALFNAQIDLRNAEHHLGETRDLYTWPTITVAQKDVDDAEAFLQYVLDSGLAAETVIYAKASLTAAEAKLDAMISSYDTEEVAIAKLQVEAAEMAVTQSQTNLNKADDEIDLKKQQVKVAKDSVEQSRQSVELARQSVELARQSVGQAQQSVELNQQSLEQAQKNLDEATITAPFSGTVASVDAEEGDTIITTTTIVHIVAPTNLELIVELDETDIPGVKINQKTIIEIDALPDITFKGIVTTIYPLPTEVGGVMLYNVKIRLDVPEDTALKIGMSASVDIVLDKRSNVLLVPDRAIEEDSQGNPVVRVMVNEQIQERPVVIGLSDSFDTEIISGLSEGETVIESRVRQ